MSFEVVVSTVDKLMCSDEGVMLSDEILVVCVDLMSVLVKALVNAVTENRFRGGGRCFFYTFPNHITCPILVEGRM
jgi:hypothetical protein